MSTDKIPPSNNYTGPTASDSSAESQHRSANESKQGVSKNHSADRKIPDHSYSCPETKALAKRATEELKTAFSEGLKKLSLVPVDEWSTKYKVTPAKIRELLKLHDLIQHEAKNAKNMIPIQERTITDPGFLKFIQEAEQQVIRNNPYFKRATEEKKKKTTRADRVYKRKAGHTEPEDYSDSNVGITGESSYKSVDRKVSDSSGIDSDRVNPNNSLKDPRKTKK